MKKYTIKTARNNSKVPAILDNNGMERPLHSLIDPQKEAARLLGTRKGERFLIFLGLGGGFSVAHALDAAHGGDVQLILIIDYDREGLDELFKAIDYTPVMTDPRVFLLVDPAPAEIESFIVRRYQPILMNGMRVFPLRARVDVEREAFKAAEAAIGRAIEQVRADYSVQAHFGLRWFSHIVQNIKTMSLMQKNAGYRCAGRRAFCPPKGKGVKCAAVTAAGPSLERSLPLLKEQRTRYFIIATDTSLPALLAAGIEPDVAISIDCQLWTYNHFFRGTRRIPLFLDLASSPLLAERSAAPYFFAGGHPLSLLFSRQQEIPEVDTSGGNVTYAAVSLAEAFGFGAETVELFGADFSYPRGVTYARGTWLYPFYDKQQHRLSPTETFFSHLLYRTALEKRYADGSWYYETPILAMYRAKLAGRKRTARIAAHTAIPSVRSEHISDTFLAVYRERLRSLSLRHPSDAEGRLILTTLLPTAAALKYRSPELDGDLLLEAAREWCMKRL
ncbi:MAG: DUF115 domain-containing protein [Treponema sp.]|nr:DUF115 domain-containing protein [Treponema sp.]